MSEGIIYLINHVSAKTLTTGQMILSGTKSPPVEVSTPVIVTLTTGQMVNLRFYWRKPKEQLSMDNPEHCQHWA
jgi:hypothetical protein